MIASMWFATAFAGECARVAVAEQSLDLSGATGFVVKGVEGSVEVVGVDGNAIKASGTACTSETQVRLTRKAGVVYAAAKGAKDADLQLKIEVPRSLAVLTVQDQTGALSIHDLPARVAAVSTEGAVEVHGAQSVRLAYGNGGLVVDGVRGDVTVDHLTGSLAAKAVGGNVTLATVTGPVSVDDVGGNLAVEGGSGGVSQTNVRGTVRLP